MAITQVRRQKFRAARGLDDLTLDSLRLNNGKLDVGLADAVTAATIERRIDASSTFTLTIQDEVRGTPRRRRFLHNLNLNAKSTVRLDGLLFDLVQISKSQNQLTLIFESAGIADLRKFKGPVHIKKGTMTRSEFVRRLVREARWVKVRAEPGDHTKVGLTRGGKDNPQENSWDAIARLAEERRYRAFESEGTVWFGSDKWLMTQGNPFKVAENDEAVLNIDFESDSGKKAQTATVECTAKRWAARPGVQVDIDGMGPVCNGKWLVESLSRSLFSQLSLITLVRPQKALPEPKPAPVAKVPGGVGGGAAARIDVAGGTVQEKIRAVFGANAQKALCIAEHESGFRNVYNGSCCYGVFQIHAAAHNLPADRLLNDVDYNLAQAYRISSGGRNWSAWTTNGFCGGP